MSMVEKLSKSRIDKITDDLIKRFPEGPDGAYEKSDYSFSHDFSRSAQVWRDVPVAPAKHFGYALEDLVQVWMSMDDGNIRDYIRKRWPDLGHKGVSRRYNMLFDRLIVAQESFTRSDGAGIWKVSPGNLRGSIYVYAGNKESAILLGRAILAGGGWIGRIDSYDVKRINVANAETLSHYNKKSLSNVEGKMKDAEKRIEDLKERIECLKTLHESLDSLGELQPDLMK